MSEQQTLGSMFAQSGDGVEALSPGHFLIGQPLSSALPERDETREKMSLLHHWVLTRHLTQHR